MSLTVCVCVCVSVFVCVYVDDVLIFFSAVK